MSYIQYEYTNIPPQKVVVLSHSEYYEPVELCWGLGSGWGAGSGCGWGEGWGSCSDWSEGSSSGSGLVDGDAGGEDLD